MIVSRPHKLHAFNSNDLLVEELASAIIENLSAAIAQRDCATLAVSGGSTPRTLFQALAQSDQLDWSKVVITQVDERWLEEDHVDANARLIRQHLLQGPAASACFVGMKTDHDSPFDAELAASDKLERFAAGIDVVVLGMGEDGHTASFFPGAEQLSRALDKDSTDLCVAIHPPAAPYDRMTLSLAAIRRAGHLYLHLVGEGKQQVLSHALSSAEMTAAEIEALPIRSVLVQDQPMLEIYYAARS